MASSAGRTHTATARFVRVSPRKARVVLDMVRGKHIDEALNILRFSNKEIAKRIYKLLDSAISNVQQSDLDWDIDRLIVSKTYANEGPTMRRFRPRAMGRATRIRKRTSHITIELGEI